MKTLNVDLGDRSYPIFIGADLLANAELVAPFIGGREVVIVTNETVAPLYLERVKTMLPDKRVEAVILPDGEEYKTLEVLDTIFTAMLEHHFSRRTTVIALGGGVVGDMAGFAAACYQRGVPFIQMPTTLLAQVDSSVGGKTAVNHPLGKNMIGAFYQPRCVVADIATLKTLEPRQLSAGLAEVIKYGLIIDAEFLAWQEENMERLLALDEAALIEAVERSCQCKADVVAADEQEQGIRALLNLGHTFGHAIETGMGYGQWLHGEAVAAGMYMAADLSARLGWIDRADVERVEALLARAKLPVRGPEALTTERMLALMAVDKKVVEGQIRLVLLKALGQAVVTDEFPVAALRETLEACRQ